MELLTEWGLEILFGLISAIVLGYAKWHGDKLKKQLNQAQELAKQQELLNIENTI